MCVYTTISMCILQSLCVYHNLYDFFGPIPGWSCFGAKNVVGNRCDAFQWDAKNSTMYFFAKKLFSKTFILQRNLLLNSSLIPASIQAFFSLWE